MQFHVTIYSTRVFTHMLREVSIVQLDTLVSGCLGKESTDHFHTSNESFTLFIKSPATSCRHSQALIVSDPDASQHSQHYPTKQQPPLPHTSPGTYCLCEMDRSDITKTPLSVCGIEICSIHEQYTFPS